MMAVLRAKARLVLWFAAALAMAACSSPPPAGMPGAPAPAAPPTEITRAQVDLSRLGEDPFLYARDETKSNLFETVSVGIVTDGTGAVVEAKPVGGPTRYFDLATAAAGKARYRPFAQVAQARFVDYVRILPAELSPRMAAPRPMATAGGPTDATITLRRTACRGTCPAYTVTITGRGQVTWQGDAHVDIAGPLSYQVEPADVARLIGMFEAAEFFALEDRYRAKITDGPTSFLTLRQGSRTKTVEDYIGYAVGMPMSVARLEKAIDDIAGTGRWIRGDETTVPGLRAAGWDFRSPAAADALACGVQRMPENLIAQLLAEGTGAGGTCDGQSALALAAEAGRHDAVVALIRVGADIGIRDSSGRTLAQIAAQENWTDVSEMLGKRGQ